MQKCTVSKIGHARVSTGDQNLELQRDALAQAGCSHIYEETASGKSTTARPELAQCLKALRTGDALVVVWAGPCRIWCASWANWKRAA